MKVKQMPFTPEQIKYIERYVFRKTIDDALKMMKDVAAQDADELRLLLRFRKLDVAERKALLLELERKSKIVSIRTAGGG